MFSRGGQLNQYSPTNLTIWCLLAAQAGAINAGGFLAVQRFVTHTTGFATLFGTELAEGNLGAAVSMATVPIFFLIGAMISALLVDQRIAHEKRAHYKIIFATTGFILLLVSCLGNGGSFGAFGLQWDSKEIFGPFVMLSLLCLSSGMQNGTVTSASGAVIRTTHMTGLTTDLGIGIVRLVAAYQDGRDIHGEMRKSGIRLSLISSFIFGAAIGAFLFTHVHYWGFLIPSAMSFGLMFYGFYSDHRANKQVSARPTKVS